MRRRFCGLENEYLILVKIMMKKLINSRALLLSSVLVMCLVSPMRAQKSDGFFRNDVLYDFRADDDLYFNLTNQHFGDGNNITYQLYNQHFGQTLPLGEGLLIMIGAGVCYVIRKRKRR